MKEVGMACLKVITLYASGESTNLQGTSSDYPVTQSRIEIDNCGA
jgi:hypothetical protein